MSEEVIIEDLKNHNNLSYNDYGDDYVTVLHNGMLVDDVEVFTDRENSNREYVVINNEIIYLDTIKKI